ncbi:MAG: bifunctional 4-hydroxy-2-oxoglutarate aldolase/2-dehydro-3-deoxy-phosphogluconate aldolase [Sporomusaceae bacterium]|nr:bifunctional 4-hydroxy-2-oxoglutarate aldolase/2-dehydro-3-deoxy-phosphogluconate aldolase [Sporomusaceae bacterium]
MKARVLQAITEPGVIAIMRGFSLEESLKAAEALIKGGVRAIEATSNTKGAVTILKNLVKEFGQNTFIGAGTVLKEEELFNAIDAGATFILAPNFDRVIVQKTVAASLVSIPGAFTPTEVVAAHNAGADFIKVFPVSSVGPQYIKDLKAPLNDLPLLPVGGVNLENAAAFIKAGATALGVGSGLVPGELIKNQKFAELTRLAEAFLEKIREARL